MLRIDWAGEEWLLLAGRGLYWPRREMLLVADTHFGKPSTFRRAGIPVPEEATDATLSRLDALLTRTGARTLVVLGDLLHAALDDEDVVWRRLADWRDTWRALAWVVVAGNHDRSAGRPPTAFDIEYHDRYFELDGIRLQHHPASLPDCAVVAGHVHPGFVLYDVGQTPMRMPCFHLQRDVLTLPAVGAFTGNGRVRPTLEDRVFVCGDDEVIELPPVERKR